MYSIEQKTRYGWEVVPEGDFDTLKEADEAMEALKSRLKWSNLRIVVCGRVVSYGDEEE